MTNRLRSLLFVPGNRPDLAVKAPRCEPDGVVLDLEDAVPPGAKADARAAVTEAVGPLSAEVPVYVRVNPPGTPWYEDDVAALPAAIAGVVVPKLESASQLAAVAGSLGGVGIVAGLETVRGVMDARDVLCPPATACYFGAEDYVYDLGGIRTDDNAEIASPRAMVAGAARLGGLAALDMVTLDFKNSERFDHEARQARALGYTGKLCIHPAQVALANAAFLPTDQEVERARNLLAAFAEAGGTTIAFEGQMVDEVVAARARAVLGAVDEN